MRELSGGPWADLARACSGVPAVMRQACDCTRHMGKCVVVGVGVFD
jgi:threonine dehydrogenase-like Zn-dependent dehydrogenase